MAKEIYTMGAWQVKPGKEDEFAREWKDFATRSIGRTDGALDARLLRDITKKGSFATFGSWKSAENIEKWRESPVFKNFMEKANELCEEMQVRTFEVAVHVTK